MNIILDTSIIIAVIANEPERKAILKATANTDLLAPSSVHWEIGNAFSAMLKHKRVNLGKCFMALNSYQKIPIQFVDVDLKEALAISEKFNIYAYDAYVIICALKYGHPLLSLDKKLISVAKKININVIEVDL